MEKYSERQVLCRIIKIRQAGTKVEKAFQNVFMYQDQVTTPEEAVCHLFFHCCLQDGEYTDREIELLSEKMVLGGLNAKLNFKEEIIKYRAYYDAIRDEVIYVRFLIDVIKPLHPFALFSYCIELCLTDAILGAREEHLLQVIGYALNLDATEQTICRTVMLQRKTVELRKIF